MNISVGGLGYSNNPVTDFEAVASVSGSNGFSECSLIWTRGGFEQGRNGIAIATNMQYLRFLNAHVSRSIFARTQSSHLRTSMRFLKSGTGERL